MAKAKKAKKAKCKGRKANGAVKPGYKNVKGKSCPVKVAKKRKTKKK
jgi:hypothetical protein